MPKLVAMMIVRNEANRYLRMCLDDLIQYTNEIVILDDGSTDHTPNICASYRKVRLIRNPDSRFWNNESALRQQCWNETIARLPEWILAIDADEMVEDRMKSAVQHLMMQKEYSQIAFQLVEFWGSRTHYRADKLWNPQNRWVVNMIKYHPGYPYRWQETPLHCGRLPCNLPGKVLRSGLRWKHYGYANQNEHRQKFEAYISHDPEGRYCPLSHYLSIMDTNPELRRWIENSRGKGKYYGK